MIFITLYLLHSEYESSSRPKTASKSIHMIMHENPNNAESEIIKIASSADEKKDSSTNQIDSENTNTVIQQAKKKH